MSHMVIYRGSDGKPGYHQADDIHDAVSFVEEMRNNEGVDHARIFRLEEVNFEFKPYYRVEIGEGSGLPAVTMGDDDAAEADSDAGSNGQDAIGASDDDDSADDDDSDDDDDDSDGETAAGARRGLFGR